MKNNTHDIKFAIEIQRIFTHGTRAKFVIVIFTNP